MTKANRRIDIARLAGSRRNYTMKEFKRQLLYIGLTKYVKVILPIEIEKDKDDSYIQEIIKKCLDS